MKIVATCPLCGETHYLDLIDDEFELFKLYEAGFGHIQDMLPMLNPTEREFLMTGYCPNCQKMLFGVDTTTDHIHPGE